MGYFEEKMCHAAAMKLLSSLDSLQSVHFKENKIPDNLISVMSKFNLTEQILLAQRAQKVLALSIDSVALERQITELENQRDNQELEDIYFLQGAPLALMRRLFGMHASEFSRRRSVLNIKGEGSGRPALCDEHTEHTIWAFWQEYHDDDERLRFLKIAEQTNLDLHLIWSALREHIHD